MLYVIVLCSFLSQTSIARVGYHTKGCLQFATVMDKAAENFLAQVFCDTGFLLS